MRSTAAALAGAAATGILLSLVPAAPAAAASCAPNPLGTAGSYTEFVEGDAKRYSDSEGAVAVGGNAVFGDSATGQGFSVGRRLDEDDLPGMPGGKSLVVKGRLTANQVVVSKGAAVFGDLEDVSRPGSFAISGKASKGDSPIDFGKEFTRLRADSTRWAAVEGNGSATRPGGSKSLLLTGSESGLNVFRVDAAELQKTDRIALKVPAGSTTLVTVLGSSYDMTGLYAVQIWDPQQNKFVTDDYTAGSAQFKEIRSRLLWNFPQATSVKKNYTSWPGTILAPDATVQLGYANGPGKGETGPGHVNGAVIAKSLRSVPGAETHQMPFRGCLPTPVGGTPEKQPPTPPPAPAPTPIRTVLPEVPAPGPSEPGARITTKPPISPSAGSASSPSASPSSTATTSGTLATTGAGPSTGIILGAVTTVLLGGGLVAATTVRSRGRGRVLSR
ncbi:choice-of-anchor A family protein [Streptomyces sp. NPDC057910]|uniref:choice-of-anchor A family protein n=1 Tax=Streptomyces sp. NPDC057910 TaxID=3346278 RepID=UPI0036E2E542